MEKLLGFLPEGCRFSGESRLVQEINRGRLGRNVKLVRDRRLGFGRGDQVYRFVRLKPCSRHLSTSSK
jgi:hypothetical protein